MILSILLTKSPPYAQNVLNTATAPSPTPPPHTHLLLLQVDGISTEGQTLEQLKLSIAGPRGSLVCGWVGGWMDGWVDGWEGMCV